MPGFPDYQRITQWLGAPLDQRDDYALGAATVDFGPYDVGNWASLILWAAPAGGAVTLTLRQTPRGAPAALVVETVVNVAAGAVAAEAVVLVGDRVTLRVTGTVAGTLLDWALVPSNTTTAATFRSTDLTLLTGRVSSAGVKQAGTGWTVSRTGIGNYTITFDTAFAGAPAVQFTAIGAPSVAAVTWYVASTSATQVAVVCLRGDNSFAVDQGFDFYATEFT